MRKLKSMQCPECSIDLLDVGAGGCQHFHGIYTVWYALRTFYPNGETDVRINKPGKKTAILKFDRLVLMDEERIEKLLLM